MSTANQVKSIPPTEALLAIIQTYEDEIRQVAGLQESSASIAELDLPAVCKKVEEQYLENHHAKIAADYSTEPPAYAPSIFLLNGGSYYVPAEYVLAIIPLVILDAVTARAKFPQSDPIQLQAGSMIYFAAAAGGARLETKGGGRVVCFFFLFKVGG